MNPGSVAMEMAAGATFTAVEGEQFAEACVVEKDIFGTRLTMG